MNSEFTSLIEKAKAAPRALSVGELAQLLSVESPDDLAGLYAAGRELKLRYCEQGVLAGANVVMPNVTDVQYRRSYQLYANKPNLDENAEAFRDGLDRRLAAIGEHILYDQLGDSRHFAART